MKKETYIEPIMEIILFEVEDIITSSAGNVDDGIILPDDIWKL